MIYGSAPKNDERVPSWPSVSYDSRQGRCLIVSGASVHSFRQSIVLENYYAVSQSLEDIARLAGVSRSTVSRVINNHPNVSPATRERVLEVIHKKNFQPNLAARSLAKGRSHVLA